MNAPVQQVERQTISCLMCHGTGRNRRGGPCPSCHGRGNKVLSANPTVRTLQLVGRIIGGAFLAIQALAGLVLALAVLAVIVIIVLAIAGVPI